MLTFRLARKLTDRLHMRLPPDTVPAANPCADWCCHGFKIDRPLGIYNPDWAIVKEGTDGKNKVYLIRETKSGPTWHDIPKPERDKIRCGKAHFSTLGVDYAWVTSASQV